MASGSWARTPTSPGSPRRSKRSVSRPAAPPSWSWGRAARRARSRARWPARASDLPGAVVAWDAPEWTALARGADLLVNATPLGRRDEMPLRPNALPQNGAVLDLVYVEGGTPLVRKARSLGLRTADGWTVLLAQGARSFELWTQRKAPVDVMREALTAA